MDTVEAIWQVPRRHAAVQGQWSYVQKALFTTWVRYEPLVCMRPQRKRTAREFLAMWGGLFQKYRSGLWWYYGVGLWESAAAGLVGSVQPTSEAGCDAQRAALLVLCVVAAAAVLVLRPLASTPLHWLSAVQEVMGVATGACVVATSVVGVEVCSRVQLGLSCVSCLLSVCRNVHARRVAAAHAAAAQESFSSVPSLSVASLDELSHLVHVMSYPPQCRMQSEDRLRQLVAFVATQQQGHQLDPPHNH